MSLPLLGAIDAWRGACVQDPEDLLQRVWLLGNGHDVNAVGHQAIGEHAHAVFRAVLSQPREIGRSIRVAKEHVLAAVAALGDVVWNTGEDGAGDSWFVVSERALPQGPARRSR